MLPWLQSVLSNTECCSMRSRPESTKARFPAPARPRNYVRSHETALGHLPEDFFLKLADLCANDPLIAVRIEDDRTSPLIWGEARSLRVHFLQMCIRDQWDHCKEIWGKLAEFERREFMHVYHHGPQTRDFFLDIMVNDDQAWKEISDCGSSSSGRSSTSSYGSMSEFTTR